MRKLLAILLVVTLCVSSMLMVSAATNYIYGDANGDQSVDIKDTTEIQKHIANISKIPDEYLPYAKVYGDEEITIKDATEIQKKVAGIIDKFPCEEGGENRLLNSEVTVYFTNNNNWTKVYAYVWGGSVLKAWPGTAMTLAGTNEYGEKTYSLKVDTAVYDWILFTDGTKQTVDIPLSVGSSAYFIDNVGTTNGKYYVGTYAYGQSDQGQITTKSLAYNSALTNNKTKKVTVWTPAGYDANDKTKKYAVLYMTDGQNIFGDIAKDSNCSPNEWEADENILSLMSNGADGVIVVGMDDATSNRDSELTPNIGKTQSQYNSFNNGTGEYYSNWVVNTVMPYVESNFNVTSERELTGIMGSSSGGLEAFYIGIENQDKFGAIGAISPAFALFSQSTWLSYLSKYDFTSSATPRIYFYNGNGDSTERELYDYSVSMQSWLVSLGYDKTKLKTLAYESAAHNEIYWRIVFSQALSFIFGYSN